MLKTIIIPISDWQNIDVAVAYAAALATPFSARVILLGIMPDQSGDVTGKFVDPVMWTVTRSESKAMLNEHMQKLRTSGIKIKTELMPTPSIEALFHYIGKQDCNLMIVPVGSEARSPFIESVLKHAHIPVLLAHTGTVNPVFRNILVPLDGSQRAEICLNLAAGIAHRMKAQLHLAHIVQKPEIPRSIRASAEDLDMAQRLVERNMEEARRYINQVAAGLSLKVSKHILTDQKVTTALHNLASQQEIDLLILSAHGNSGEPRWHLGTVAENLVHHSELPTIVVQDLPAHLSSSLPEVARVQSGTR